MATIAKRQAKENQILDAAESIFRKVGFANSKMEDVAKEAGISKGLVYFYFGSKENLYMGITYRAFQKVTDLYYQILDQNGQENGMEVVLKIMKAFTDFCMQNVLYSEAMLDYISIARSATSDQESLKLTDAIKESIYFKKTQDIQSIPISIVVKEIKRGVEDGSIANKQQPELIYLTAWAMVIGFIKLNTQAGSNKTTILKVNVSDWQDYMVNRARAILQTP